MVKRDSQGGTHRLEGPGRPVSVWFVGSSGDAELVRGALGPGCEVTTFTEGGAALAQMKRERPDAVVLDGACGRASMAELTEALRADPGVSEVPLALLATMDTREALYPTLRCGLDDYVTRPFDQTELALRLTSLVARGQRQRDADARLAQYERFVTMLVHDLRQPLSAFVFGVRRISTKAGPADAKTLQALARASERMRRLVGSLLDLGRARLGQAPPIVRYPVDLVEVCTTSIEEIKLTHPDRRIVLHAAGDCVGSWDGDRVGQLCGNLIGNAVDHGHPERDILVDVQSRENAAVLIVENAGAPIPDEVLDGLFDPFRGRKDSPGLGLGLYIARQIARAHGGDIEVTSDEARTRFVAVLPTPLTSGLVRCEPRADAEPRIAKLAAP